MRWRYCRTSKNEPIRSFPSIKGVKTKQIGKICSGKKVNVTIVEVKNPDLDATLIAKQMAEQLEARVVSCIDRMNKVELNVYGRLRNMPVDNWEAYLEGFLDYEEYLGMSVSKAPNILNFFNICMEYGFNAVSQSINSYNRKLYS